MKKTEANVIEAEKPEETRPKRCFVIGPIGEDGSDTRRHADLLLDFVIRPVLGCEPFSYDVLRADTLGESGMITNQIVEHLISDDLVVADLSYLNANAFYELAIRHGVRKPFIHIHRKGDRPPFDVTTNRAIAVDLTDLRSVEAAKIELAAQARHIGNGGMPDSPLAFSIDLLGIGKSSPEAQMDQRVLTALSALSQQVTALQPTVSNGEIPIREKSKFKARLESAMRVVVELETIQSDIGNSPANEPIPSELERLEVAVRKLRQDVMAMRLYI